MQKNMVDSEQMRLDSQGEGSVPVWHKWGPYVSERSWGTVREDYSVDGSVWTSFPFEEAHMRAYHWGEDAIAGFCDRYQVLVCAPVFWNGEDEILKERLFGLSSEEGNHGEDVKEIYFHEDALPSHAYMKYVYRYPHGKFPYDLLRQENKRRTVQEAEYEIKDTGIFVQDAYFAITIEYAKSTAEDFFVRIEAKNCGKQSHDLHLLPHLWFRNQWQFSGKAIKKKPQIYQEHTEGYCCLIADDEEMGPLENLGFPYQLGKRYFYGPSGGEYFCTENETYDPTIPGSYKNAFHEVIIKGKDKKELPKQGTKGCLYYYYPSIPPASSVILMCRLSIEKQEDPFRGAEDLFIQRRKEADLFYQNIHPPHISEEEKKIQRQALAGMIWNKQIYLYDVTLWLKEHGHKPHAPLRNVHWKHLNSMRIFSMPDKWEYPWFAAWDQAFHSVIWSLLDLSFAKEQLWLLLFDQFQHPNGQIPAYEWEFSDLNPPLQGWACLQIYEQEKRRKGKGDRDFLEKCFHKLLMNFSWWVNKVDSSGNNVFEGGFLGLDNITVIDRSQKRMEEMTLQQSDGTGWMAFFCLNLMKIALELSKENKVYEALGTKFFEHYVYIAQAMMKKGEYDIELWDEQDGFFYDVLRHKDGSFSRFPIRSLVGIIPLFAMEWIPKKELRLFPDLERDLLWFLKNRKHLVSQSIMEIEIEGEGYYVFTPMNMDQLRSVLGYIWNPEEFRAEFGLRSLSKYHENHPFLFQGNKIEYEPAESLARIKGGNSNWRGPVWMPLNFLLLQSLSKLSFLFGRQIQVQAPGEASVSLEEMAESFAQRLLRLFPRNIEDGKYLFYEYFHPDTGRGMGASHQSGWTSLIANIIDSLHRKERF